MANVLMLLPSSDYDPTETAVPWCLLTDAGHTVRFATPDGQTALADRRLTETGFGPLSPWLMPRKTELALYRRMSSHALFLKPARHDAIDPAGIDALIVPGGHAKGMRSLIESTAAQSLVVAAFARNIPVGAICHGTLLLARSRQADGRSVLHGRKTTALTAPMELTAWNLTRLWLGDYYRTYPQTVASEIRAALRQPADFQPGPLLSRRDTARHPERGFVVQDGNYVSARWYGDAYRFAQSMLTLLHGS
ncbi:type 1 glutamine amidotransferase domain-containing protein [Parachitinimonas caeni]|uniref:Type 1 glutamine amidotransferase domain-containing protein n=1 Tax=Parachitinimonas caeni TaxID=3031301 RepID=A0ABT7E180_9NEIS|nr:type 1 glutamine amidotransferase domain-containing protein [Parachitinimonas caeni]MDK2126081.1 type 1 glutamine amidotransferase domain-containing protein [Parachitinimonas caeni]